MVETGTNANNEQHTDRSSIPTRSFITHLSMDESQVSGDGTRLLETNQTCEGQEDASHSEFLRQFMKTSGPPQIITVCLLISLALGSTIGVVPAVVEDRYARLKHGYDGEASCLDIPKVERPNECLFGNEDAQNSAAISGFIANSLTFATSSLIGSISDERGRVGIMRIGVGLSLLAPLNLVLMQLYPNIDPFLYYASHAISGAISWMAVALSAISDVMPPVWRAPSFGLVLAGFSMGFAVSPILAVFMSHLAISMFSLIILIAGFVFVCFYMPETLSSEAARKAKLNRFAEMSVIESEFDMWKYYAMRPINDLLILNRNKLFRLMSALAFFSGCVGSADLALFIYYVEENLGFNAKDIAMLFLMRGLSGIFVQTVILKPLNSFIGERRVIMFAFSVGALHNYLYGIASSKRMFFIASTIATFTSMSFPTISAIKANNVDEIEQGRIQGALYSLSSLASAVGPILLRYIYHRTKDNALYGKGTMFVFGSGLYVIATFCAYVLPEQKANSKYSKNSSKTVSSILGYGTSDV
ncbi:hypothetical protein HJC23_003859 [Cyclotella cryptica]|uniref:Major facilitator superfamily (MFS) profile domain-containing protein n=1 Tax=Cyclotella cryptica TaxID=29204 RepID=A0ABD3Q0L1_9STRA|eukprot:CCRYP_009999-RB/>CCRYP_009999-RB protein AED:0.03 eAED:0.03 QI:67/1/1/1/1/1/3/832/529